MKKLFFPLIALMGVLTFASCDKDETTTEDVKVEFKSAVVDDKATTEEITVTFSKEVTGLKAADFSIVDATAKAEGEEEATPAVVITDAKAGAKADVYVLSVKVTEDATVGIKVAKKGYVFTPETQDVTVAFDEEGGASSEPDPEVSFAIAAVDTEGTTTALTITFEEAVEALVAADITIAGLELTITDEDITPNDDKTVYTVAIEVTEAAELTVAIKIGDVDYGSQKVNVIVKEEPTPDTEVTVTATPDSEATTVEITLALNPAVDGLTSTDVEFATGNDEIAEVASLTTDDNGATYKLGVTAKKAGEITISITKEGYTFNDTTANIAFDAGL